MSTFAAGAILATGGAAAPIVLGGIAATAGGKLVKEVAKENDNEFFEWLGDTVSDTGINMLTGSLAGPASSVPNNLASHIGGRTAFQVMRNTKETYDAVSLSVDGVYGVGRYYHAEHRDEGISYKSDCPVCTCGD